MTGCLGIIRRLIVKQWRVLALAAVAGILALTALPPMLQAAPVPTGTTVYTGSDGGIYTIAVAGGSPREIWTPSGSGSASSPLWSPDARSVAFIGPDGNLWTAAANGANAHAITGQAVQPSNCGSDVCAEQGTQADSPRWSPSGARISYRLVERAAKASVWVVPAAGGAPAIVAQANGLCLFNEGFSPSGAALFSRCSAGAGESNETYMAASGGPSGLLGGSQLAYTTNGATVAYARQVQGDNGVTVSLFVASADGSNAKLVAQDGQNPVWSSRGLLAYEVDTAAGASIHVYDPSSGVDTVVASGQQWAWSADGSWLLYTTMDSNGASTILRVQSDGTSATPVAHGSFPSVSA